MVRPLLSVGGHAKRSCSRCTAGHPRRRAGSRVARLRGPHGLGQRSKRYARGRIARRRIDQRRPRCSGRRDHRRLHVHGSDADLGGRSRHRLRHLPGRYHPTTREHRMPDPSRSHRCVHDRCGPRRVCVERRLRRRAVRDMHEPERVFLSLQLRVRARYGLCARPNLPLRRSRRHLRPSVVQRRDVRTRLGVRAVLYPVLRVLPGRVCLYVESRSVLQQFGLQQRRRERGSILLDPRRRNESVHSWQRRELL